jgi:hypothetical protein
MAHVAENDQKSMKPNSSHPQQNKGMTSWLETKHKRPEEIHNMAKLRLESGQMTSPPGIVS